jgi:hypothetical protein
MAAVVSRSFDPHARRPPPASRMDRELAQLRDVGKSADVDAHPAWRKMRRLPRNLFHGLGTLRDH